MTVIATSCGMFVDRGVSSGRGAGIGADAFTRGSRTGFGDDPRALIGEGRDGSFSR